MTPARQSFYLADVLRFPRLWYSLIKFIIGYFSLKMEFLQFIIRLQGHTKFRYIMVDGDIFFNYILLMIHYLKHIEISIYYSNLPQHDFYRTWNV